MHACVSVCVHARVGDSSLLLEHVMVSLQVYVRVWCCHFSLSVYVSVFLSVFPSVCCSAKISQHINIGHTTLFPLDTLSLSCRI
mmetsp:Transcript_34452/g.50445  ORF Transcript_34452/g.50445 Transcript_34452/m.50445 type:complete len:84 (-) Transcript_34452:109-360(-)